MATTKRCWLTALVAWHRLYERGSRFRPQGEDTWLLVAAQDYLLAGYVDGGGWRLVTSFG